MKQPRRLSNSTRKQVYNQNCISALCRFEWVARQGGRKTNVRKIRLLCLVVPHFSLVIQATREYGCNISALQIAPILPLLFAFSIFGLALFCWLCAWTLPREYKTHSAEHNREAARLLRTVYVSHRARVV